MRKFLSLILFSFGLLPLASAQTSSVSGTAIQTVGATPLTGTITFRTNNCSSKASDIFQTGSTTPYTGVTVSVTAGAFTVNLRQPVGFCYQVGAYDSVAKTMRFLTGFGAYAPASGSVNFDSATTTATAPDTTIAPAYPIAGGNPSSGGQGSTTVSASSMQAATNTLLGCGVAHGAWIPATNTCEVPSASGGGLADPGANGLIKRTGLNTTGIGVAGTDYATPASVTSAQSAATAAQTTANTANTTANAAVPKAGGTMTGALTLNADPTTALQAATKSYVDTHAVTGGGLADCTDDAGVSIVCSVPFSAPSYKVTGTENGSIELTATGTAPAASVPANTVRVEAPSTVTPYRLVLPGTAPTTTGMYIACTNATPVVCTFAVPPGTSASGPSMVIPRDINAHYEVASPASNNYSSVAFSGAASSGTLTAVTTPDAAGYVSNSYTTGATINTAVGQASAGDVKLLNNPSFRAIFHLQSAASVNAWLGICTFCNPSLTSTTTGNLAFVGFRHVSSAEATNWTCYAGTSSASNTADSGVAVDVAKMQVFDVIYVSNVPQYYINGTRVCSSIVTTAMPAAASNMGGIIAWQNTTTTPVLGNIFELYYGAN